MNRSQFTYLNSSLSQVLVILAILAGLFWFLGQIDLGAVGGTDFQQYWAGTRLFLDRLNPYDTRAIIAIERTLPVFRGEGVYIWNPPIIFPLTFLFGYLDFELARRLWIVFTIVCFAVGLFLLERRFRRPEVERSKYDLLLNALVIVSFNPMALALSYGQVSFLLFAGWALFWFLFPRKPFWAGVFLSLTFLKPHLLFLNYIALMLSFPRRWTVICGAGLGLLVLGVSASIYNPSIFEFYVQAVATPPIDFKTPTAGSWLQGTLGMHVLWVRFAPSIVALAIVGAWLLKARALGRKFNPDILLLSLTPLSLVLSPYGWVYDQVLLLPNLIWLLSQKYSRPQGLVIKGILLVSNLTMFLVPASVGQEWFFWYPLLILGLKLTSPKVLVPA